MDERHVMDWGQIARDLAVLGRRISDFCEAHGKAQPAGAFRPVRQECPPAIRPASSIHQPWQKDRWAVGQSGDSLSCSHQLFDRGRFEGEAFVDIAFAILDDG